MIDRLLNPVNAVQVVGVRLLSILTAEFANQRALAVTAGEADPDAWFAHVLYERGADPVSYFQNDVGRYVSVVDIEKDLSRPLPGSTSTTSNHNYRATFRLNIHAAAAATQTQRAEALADARLAQTVGMVTQILGAPEYATLDTTVATTDPSSGRQVYNSLVSSKDLGDLKFYASASSDSTKVTKTAQLDIDVNTQQSAPQNTKELLNLLTVGHVDANDELKTLIEMNFPRS